MLEGHTIRRILTPIIDDVDKYQFAILGSSLRSLGLPVSLGLTRKKLAKRKGKKMKKKGVEASFFSFFFFRPCYFQGRGKSCNASYEHSLSKYFLVFIGVIRKLVIRP